MSTTCALLFILSTLAFLDVRTVLGLESSGAGDALVPAMAAAGASGVATPRQITLTFQLDLSRTNLLGSPPKQVGVRGSVPPLDWERSRPLTDPDGDGVFSATVAFDATRSQRFVEYKFVVEGAKPRWELENEANRVALLREGARTLTAVPWNMPDVFDREELARVRFTAAEVRADLALLREALDCLHPALHRHQPKASLTARWAELERSVDADRSLGETYLLVSEFVGAIRCGHTWPNFWNQSALVQHALFDGADKLPFACGWLDDGLVVTGNGSTDDRFRPGTRILRLNGVPVGTIRDRLLGYVKGDGGNRGQRLAGLASAGGGSFEALDALLPVLFPPTAGEFQVEAAAAEGPEVFASAVKATDRCTRRRALEARHGPLPSTYDELWTYRRLDGQTAHLRLGTFVTYKMKLDWKRFLRDAFQDLQTSAVPHLLVDIRGNEGGMDEVMAELASYLVKAPIDHLPEESHLRFDAVPAKLRPLLETWDRSLFDLTGEVEVRPDGLFQRKGDPPRSRPVRRAQWSFGGTVWLLVDGANSSATFHLARLCQRHGLATLVGEETGGSRRGTNGGSIFFLRLPNTGLEVDIPVYGSSLRADQPDGGIRPDLLVHPTAADVAAGRDAAITAVQNRIQAQSNRP